MSAARSHPFHNEFIIISQINVLQVDYLFISNFTLFEMDKETKLDEEEESCLEKIFIGSAERCGFDAIRFRHGSKNFSLVSHFAVMSHEIRRMERRK